MKNTFTLLLILSSSLLSIKQAKTQCTPPSSSINLEVNNVSTLLLNGGDSWWDLAGQARYEIPKGSGISPFFTSGLWIGGIDNTSGNLSLAGVKYRSNGNDYFSGPLDSNGLVTSNDCQTWDKFFSVTKGEIDAFKSGGAASNAILEWPGRGNPLTGVPNEDWLAPFYDENSDGIYNPTDGDYPRIKGDQAIWWVFNDMGNIHTETGGNALGIQVSVMAYAYKTNDELNNTTFYEYEIKKKSNSSLTDVYLGLFTDFDLGNPNDDYLAFDKSRNLSIVLNGDPFDEDSGGSLGYGANPPKAGIQFVDPPKENFSLTSIPIAGHVAFNNGNTINGDPSVAYGYYNVLRGLWRTGNAITIGNVGTTGTIPTKFMYDISDPINYWTECSAGNTPFDRRSVMSYGPFDLSKNDVIQFTYAAIWDRDTAAYICDDYSGILKTADNIQAKYDSIFRCQFFSPQVNVTVDPASIGMNNGTITVDPNSIDPSWLYVWSTGDTGTSISGLPFGIYSLQIINTLGCAYTVSYLLPESNVSIDEQAKLIHKIYPNPTHDRVTIEFVSQDGTPKSLSLYDPTGRLVLTKEINTSKHTLSVQNLAPGMYILQTKENDKMSHKTIVIK